MGVCSEARPRNFRPDKTLLLVYLTLLSFKNYANELQNCTCMHVFLFKYRHPSVSTRCTWTMLASHQNRSPRIFNEFCLFFFIISTNNSLIQDILIYFFNFEELCWNPNVHTTKGKNGVWCRNTLEIDIFRNPIE